MESDQKEGPDLYIGARTGKTTKLIERAAKDWLYIVCFSRQEVSRIASEARGMGHDIPTPMTFDEFLSGRFNSFGINGFVIDQSNELIQRLAHGIPIQALAMDGSVCAAPELDALKGRAEKAEEEAAEASSALDEALYEVNIRRESAEDRDHNAEELSEKARAEELRADAAEASLKRVRRKLKYSRQQFEDILQMAEEQGLDGIEQAATFALEELNNG